MSSSLQQTIEALAKEKGIEPDVIITAIEDAVLTASRKYYKSDETSGPSSIPTPVRSNCMPLDRS